MIVHPPPNIPYSIYKNRCFQFHKADLNTRVVGMEENRKALHCIPFEAGAQRGEGRVEDCQILGGIEADTESLYSVVKGTLSSWGTLWRIFD